MYTNLFSPIRINQLEIKNRIAYPSLGLFYSNDTKLNDKYYNFFNEIAKPRQRAVLNLPARAKAFK